MTATTIRLQEYKPCSLPVHELDQTSGEVLWRQYKNQVSVDAPSFMNNQQWMLVNQGWAGHIPLSDALSIYLAPKVSIQNLFGMFEYAYRLKSFAFLDGMVQTDSLTEFYEQLASILAKRILDRGRQGFYRDYLNENERLPFVRGKMDMTSMTRAPWRTRIHCHYEEHTADVDENQILGWTLWRIMRSGNCTERVLPTVRRAARAVQQVTTLKPFAPDDCLARVYHRLNQDYQPLHALSRFFLAQSGPSHHTGDREMIPFLVNMPNLYELFVAEWLRLHLPAALKLQTQVKFQFGLHDQYFQPDLVIRDADTDTPLFVLDTKYKAPDHASPDDIAKIIAYAQTMGAEEAVLIYPQPLPHPLDYRSNGIHIRTMAFELEGDLERAGEAFLSAL